jgi:hypothetical protein
MAERGIGERRERAARLRRNAVIGILFVAGLVTGFYVGYQDGHARLGLGGSWSPTLALVLVAIYLTAVVGGGLLLNGSFDEVDRQRGYKAASFAGAVYITVYPVWFLLWKGGLAAEPIHWVAFAIFWLSLALASIWYRFR